MLLQQMTIHLSIAMAEMEREEMMMKIPWRGDWRWQKIGLSPHCHLWYTTSTFKQEQMNKIPSLAITIKARLEISGVKGIVKQQVNKNASLNIHMEMKHSIYLLKLKLFKLINF